MPKINTMNMKSNAPATVPSVPETPVLTAKMFREIVNALPKQEPCKCADCNPVQEQSNAPALDNKPNVTEQETVKPDQRVLHSVSPEVMHFCMRQLKDKEFEIVKHRMSKFERNPITKISRTVNKGRQIIEAVVPYQSIVTEAKALWNKVHKT